MSIGSIIAISIVILIVAAIYLSYLLTYIGMHIRYHRALRSDGVIVEILEESSMTVGTGRLGTRIKRRYGNYVVSFSSTNGTITMSTSIRNRKANVGDHIEVHYEIDEKGEIKIVSEAFLAWLREKAIGYTIGILWGTVLAIMEYMDLI